MRRRPLAYADLDRRLSEAALNAFDAERWMARCARRLMALDPDRPLDGTDWDEIAGDLLEAVVRDDGIIYGKPWLSPEFVAESYVSMR